MVDVTADYTLVLKRVGIEAETVETAQYVTEAAAWLSDQVGRTINKASCTEAEAEAIRNLAAIKAYFDVTGISSTGWTANLGGLTFSGAPDKIAMINDLWKLIKEFIKVNRSTAFKTGEAEY
jgi:hypothetical protein